MACSSVSVKSEQPLSYCRLLINSQDLRISLLLIYSVCSYAALQDNVGSRKDPVSIGRELKQWYILPFKTLLAQEVDCKNTKVFGAA